MAKTIKMNISRGGPGGAILRAGRTFEIDDFWADRLIAENAAIEVKKEEKKEQPKAKHKK